MNSALVFLMLLALQGASFGAQISSHSVLMSRTAQSQFYWNNFAEGDAAVLDVTDETFEKTADFFYQNRSDIRGFFDQVFIEENVLDPGAGHDALLSSLIWPDFARAMSLGAGIKSSSGFKESSSVSLTPNLKTFRQLQSEGGKPANLILSVDRNHLAKAVAVRWAAPILNALQASGYEVRITFDQILPGQQLYYFMSEESAMRSETFRALIKLLESSQNGSGPLVMVHPLEEMRNSGRWKKVRRLFGIPSSETGWLKNPPETAQCFGKDIFWGDRGLKNKFGITRVRERRVKDEGGNTALSVVRESESLSLLLVSGNCLLVNGNYLDFESAHVFSRLMGSPVISVSDALVAARRDKIAALALSETAIKFRLGNGSNAGAWREVRFSAEGKQIEDNPLSNQSEFEIRLKPNELVILTKP